MNFDFERFKPRCSRYVMGADDESMRQIRDDLKELFEEMQSRGDLLDRYEVPQVTREIADKNVGLHPIVALLEEAHVALQPRRVRQGDQQATPTADRQARPQARHPPDQSRPRHRPPRRCPRDVTRNCTNGIAFYVGDHVANDAPAGPGRVQGRASGRPT